MDENYIQSVIDAGAPPEIIQQLREQQQVATPDFEVFEDNWQSFIFFAGLKTQWQVTAIPMGGILYMGIPSPSIESEMNIKRIPNKQRLELLYDIRVMEESALAVLNKTKD